jgi:2-polyprenyl-3-methyl-5-hydroxy-6-metoxy-1,4-benzoquinol methylase
MAKGAVCFGIVMAAPLCWAFSPAVLPRSAPRVRACKAFGCTRAKRAEREWSVGEEPLQQGLRERNLEIGGETYKVVELEKTTDLVDLWIQNSVGICPPCSLPSRESRQLTYHLPAQMARVDPFGVVLWPAAQCIVENLLHTPPNVAEGGGFVESETGGIWIPNDGGPVGRKDASWIKGLRVVELGAGTGLCSIAAASAGAKVLTTDTNEMTLDLVALAASRQSLQIETALFDITGAEALPEADVLIGADCMYNKPVAKALARRCIEAHRAGVQVFLPDRAPPPPPKPSHKPPRAVLVCVYR